MSVKSYVIEILSRIDDLTAEESIVLRDETCPYSLATIKNVIYQEAKNLGMNKTFKVEHMHGGGLRISRTDMPPVPELITRVTPTNPMGIGPQEGCITEPLEPKVMAMVAYMHSFGVIKKTHFLGMTEAMFLETYPKLTKHFTIEEHKNKIILY
jgi:hypothetical protein